MLEEIKPLFDDVANWAAKSWWRNLLAFLFPRQCLRERLRQQLWARPNVWGIGLWPDKETEEVAQVCAEIFALHYMCGASNFIPDDPIDLFEDFDPAHDLNGCEVILDLEIELNCTLPESALSNCTFGDFVSAVMKIRGPNQR